MPREYHNALIRLYADKNKSVAEINEGEEFKKLRDEFARDRDFQKERDRIEVAKTQVKTAIEEAKTQLTSVQRAIQFLIQTRGDDRRRDLCHELIVARYRPDWTAAQRQYFDDAWERIKLDYDYFLSFTTRYPDGVPGDNPVNTAYRHFIIAEIGIDRYKKADRKKTNLLAEAVNGLLSQPRIKGFYFPHTQYDNALTERKLEAACDSCLVFVQLVQTIMFDVPMGRTNYCFFEWNRVMTQFTGADRERRILFVVAAPNRNVLLDVLPFIDYNDWHGHIGQKDAPYLPEVPFRDNATLKTIRSKFQDIVVPEIRGAWFRLIEQAP